MKVKVLVTLVFLPGEFHGQTSLEGYSTWGRKESDTTEQPMTHTAQPTTPHERQPSVQEHEGDLLM